MDFLEKFEAFGAKPAIVDTAGETTFAGLAALVRDVSKTLETWGVIRGDAVAIGHGYSSATIAALLALLRMGCIAVPLANLPGPERATRLRVAHVRHLLIVDGARLVHTRIDPQGEDPALFDQLRNDRRAGLVLFSSGTTGEPKAMTHDLTALADTYWSRREKNLRILGVLLFDHVGGLNTLFNALGTGAAFVVPESLSPEAICAAVERHGVNVLPASPTLLNLIYLNEAWKERELSSLRIVTYGTEPMPEGLLAKLRTAFPRARFVQTFGTSETGIARTRSKSSDSTLIKIEGGGVEFCVAGGELLLRGQTRILGYLNAPMEQFDGDGWFHTGDLVEELEDGYLRIVGRLHEVVNVGGQKVVPGEVESVLLGHELVADCLVYGEANAITGQTVVAQVVPREDVGRRELRKALRGFCRGKLEPYKIPSKFVLLKELPKAVRLKKRRMPAPEPSGAKRP